MKETLEERVYRLGVKHLSIIGEEYESFENVLKNPFFLNTCRLIDDAMKEEREECAQLIESFGKIKGVEPIIPILNQLATTIRLRSHKI